MEKYNYEQIKSTFREAGFPEDLIEDITIKLSLFETLENDRILSRKLKESGTLMEFYKICREYDIPLEKI